MSIILDRDFLEELKNVQIDLMDNGYEETMLEAMPDLFKQLNAIYELRHIFAHELAVKTKTNLKKQWDMVIASIVFVFTTENLMEDLGLDS